LKSPTADAPHHGVVQARSEPLSRVRKPRESLRPLFAEWGVGSRGP
jgi:hypothetical protein